ncbi:hypothetical protein DFQ27_005455 [Actinomortierella ambigua]|uniref:Uncharacterized protein n=1 Tax=Actinomortierella ambigua TaxID=1343610 RepID=A0A9P6UCD1_9FUNG|nr:hypothetical protein DFQ27_005455 [Actinomortierella ambigua]
MALQVTVNFMSRPSGYAGWILLVVASWLFILYWYSVRAVHQVKKLMRAVPILVLTGYLAAMHAREAVFIERKWLQCEWDDYSPSLWTMCTTEQALIIIALSTSILTAIEVVFTVIVGPLNPFGPEHGVAENIELVSPDHPTPAGLQSAGSEPMPYGHHVQPQPYSAYPDGASYPVMPPESQHQQQPYPPYQPTAVIVDGSQPPFAPPEYQQQQHQAHTQYPPQYPEPYPPSTYMQATPIVAPSVPQLVESSAPATPGTAPGSGLAHH